jgi:hypothetical protein
MDHGIALPSGRARGHRHHAGEQEGRISLHRSVLLSKETWENALDLPMPLTYHGTERGGPVVYPSYPRLGVFASIRSPAGQTDEAYDARGGPAARDGGRLSMQRAGVTRGFSADSCTQSILSEECVLCEC